MRLRCRKVSTLFRKLRKLIAFTRRPTTATSSTTSATHIYGFPARVFTSPNGIPCGISWPAIPTTTAWFCRYSPTTSRFFGPSTNTRKFSIRCYPWPANGFASVPTQSSPSTAAPDQLSVQTTQPTIPRTASWSLRSYDSLFPPSGPTAATTTTTITVHVETSPSSTPSSSTPTTTTVADQHHCGHFS